MSKRKWLIVTIVVITLLVLSTLTVLAIITDEPIMSQISKVTDLKNTQTISITKDNVSYTKIANRAEDFLNKSTLSNNGKKLNTEELKIEFVEDNVTNEEYYEVKASTALLHITENGIVTTYLNTSPETTYSDFIADTKFKTSTSNLNLEERAKEVFYKTGLVENTTNYSLVKVEEKETYFPTAWFESLLNKRIIFFAFNPETLEILNMGNQKMILSQNNEVKITEEQAKSIAIKKVSKSLQDIKDIKLDEVVPNEFFKQNDEDAFYTILDYKRRAFIVTFNDMYSTQVYVDATTGEVIGGNGVW